MTISGRASGISDTSADNSYDQESFEEDDERTAGSPVKQDPLSASPDGRVERRPLPSWKTIDFAKDIILGSQIGGGGLGVVHRGWYRGESVALKTLFDPRMSPDLMQEFMDELLIMSRLNHPNIVKFIGASAVPPNLFFVMELCRCSLFDMLHTTITGEHDDLTIKDRVRICVETARAMNYLHSRNPCIIHRDLKSHNVLLSHADDGGGAFGSVRLCDFGLVRVRDPSAGTPNYQAPEVLEGRGFTSSVDVYAFAVLVWEIFARDIPFRGNDRDEIQLRVCNGDRPRIPTLDTPSVCREIIKSGWNGDRNKRPSFGLIVKELDNLLTSLPEKKTESLMDDVGCGEGDALDAIMGLPQPCGPKKKVK